MARDRAFSQHASFNLRERVTLRRNGRNCCHKEIFCQVMSTAEFCDVSHFILFLKAFIPFGFSSVTR